MEFDTFKECIIVLNCFKHGSFMGHVFLYLRAIVALALSACGNCVIKFVYGRPSGSAGSAFCFPYNSVTVRRILFKFGRFRQ